MKPISFCVRAWNSWAPDADLGNAKALPSPLRRRVTPIGQRALNAAWELPKSSSAKIVLSSRHGEFGRTLSLLKAAVDKEDLSPADFSLSVHNALTGLFSIARHNSLGHVAVASGEESFCYGLMESAISLNENPETPVVLFHFDEPLPEPFSQFEQPSEPALAMALELHTSCKGDEIQFSREPSPENITLSSSHAWDFVNFLKHNLSECVSQNKNYRWRWARHASH